MADLTMDDMIFFSGFCCCNNTLYTEVPDLIGCSGARECLCIRDAFCCKAGADPFGIGLKTDGDDLCEISLYCCQCALKVPTTCCKGKSQCLCCVSAAALPPSEDIPMTCGTCFVACLPGFGVFKTLGELKK